MQVYTYIHSLSLSHIRLLQFSHIFTLHIKHIHIRSLTYPLCLFIYHIIFLPIFVFLTLSICLFISISLSFSLYFSLSKSISLSLSLSLSNSISSLSLSHSYSISFFLFFNFILYLSLLIYTFFIQCFAHSLSDVKNILPLSWYRQVHHSHAETDTFVLHFCVPVQSQNMKQRERRRNQTRHIKGSV